MDMPIVEISYQDAQYLMHIAEAEAGNQGVEGMALVMQVVLNRVKSPKFPNTVKEVISQKHQFQTYSNGKFFEVEPSCECHLALAEIEMGNYSHYPMIIGFEQVSSTKLNAYFDYAFTYKGHDFYVFKQPKRKKHGNKSC